jgi:hypothetical protein
VCGEEIHILLAPIFFYFEVLLRKTVNNMPASVTNNNVQIDQAAVDLKGRGIGRILCPAFT